RDDFARMWIGVELRRASRQAMKICERDDASAAGTGHVNLGVERRQRDAHVGGMRRDAGLAGAEDRVHAIEAVDGGAAAARLAFVARRRRVVEIITARPREGIAAGGSYVAQLL